MPFNSYLSFFTGTDVFVSYRWTEKTKQYTKTLCQEFEKRRLEYYLDDKALPKGENIPKSFRFIQWNLS